MWSFASTSFARTIGLKNGDLNGNHASPECSDDETSSSIVRWEGLECPICCESFNVVENVPYVLYCGHTLCKNCVLGLQRAVIKLPTVVLQLPFFISCPWCNLLSLRLVYQGNLRFPRKNFFLLWMLESINGDRSNSHSFSGEDYQPVCSAAWSVASGYHASHLNQRQHRENPQQHSESDHNEGALLTSHLSSENFRLCLHKSLTLLTHLIAKFPLVAILLLIILYVIPASAIILLVYILITVLFALPSFLVLYFAYPSLVWLIKEIIS